MKVGKRKILAFPQGHAVLTN